MFYSTMIIGLFNTTFQSQYNNSLFGMAWITTLNTFISENVNRKSVGVPVRAHTKDELAEIEKQKQNATGFKKSYYDFMARLTGKKSLVEQQQDKKAKLINNK